MCPQRSRPAEGHRDEGSSVEAHRPRAEGKGAVHTGCAALRQKALRVPLCKEGLAWGTGALGSRVSVCLSVRP